MFRLNILIGGKAGQGINKVSEIVSQTLINHGYFTFNYRDYPSLVRGGHNFNILSISDKKIQSHESKINCLIALDEKTLKKHKAKEIISYEKFKDKKLGKNLNIALAGSLIKFLGIPKKELLREIKKEFNSKEAIQAAEEGFNEQEQKFELKKLKNKLKIMCGSAAVAQGAINSELDLYIAYPMTPATGVLHNLAASKIKTFQSENEIGAVNQAIGASFAGKKSMVGTSGGGFDLMSETLSLQGMSEIPLTVYLCSRPGPGTGVPTYTEQADLDIALKAGHGEFPRIVIAPGDVEETIEKTNQALYLAEKFKTLSIILSDKHLAESEFTISEKIKTPKKINITRDLPGEKIVKATSYEHDKFGNTIEDPETTIKGHKRRLENHEKIKKFIETLEPIKIHGKKNSKNLVIAWGSTKGATLDAINEINQEKQKSTKFLQVLYLKPLSEKIKKEMQKAENIILIENNSTGQLGKLLREKTLIPLPEKNHILKYDARPFTSDELKKEMKKRLK